MNVTVVGMGYVGLSNAILLAQNNKVIALEIIKEKVELINQKISPIQDVELSDYLKNKKLNLIATTNEKIAYKEPDLVVVATPTNYDDETNQFDTESIESVLNAVKKYTSDATVLIKSTVPVGYTNRIRERYTGLDIIFSPEFLREGNALYDNLYPSRIIVGNESPKSDILAKIFLESTVEKDCEVILMPSTEAEAVKLFSNTYLALRISFFNELDTYAEVKGLDTQQIINGVGLDPRIGNFYNNPSFGYGGYCLPKDTKQMLANYQDIPNNLIKAIVDSNITRKEYIASQILSKNVNKIGIYRLTMKTGSDNFRQSAIFDVIDYLRKQGKEIIIFEPGYDEREFEGMEVCNDLEDFKLSSDLIVANRYNKEKLSDVKHKIYTRDIFHQN